jgi:hypothetical protein
MIEKIKLIIFKRYRDRKFLESLIDLEKIEPNNYQFGSAIREKIKLYKSDIISTEVEKKRYSH